MLTSSTLAAFCCAALSSLSIAAPTSVPQSSPFVQHPDHMNNGTLYSISAFSPKVFVRTDEFELNYKSCVQFSYKLMKEKVRLRAYACLLSEGGFCTLDKFAFPKHKEGCAYLRPWLFPFDRYSFYFVLEYRPRKYRSIRDKRHRRILRRNEQSSTTPYGDLELYGIVPCEKVCGKKEANNRTS
ncbi:hypothetical protein KIN20_004711 [Parelaphostrongylus tenuis]|uniref:Uncharacterized protein n=1 Tax=Parelaphostrongylus tenuis TaxID=148309 RepID=A0AAD5MHP0_PARTN|nr:hypothetical protein KIN20_004711 [Parelaphostrongylus tenuis]